MSKNLTLNLLRSSADNSVCLDAAKRILTLEEGLRDIMNWEIPEEVGSGSNNQRDYVRNLASETLRVQ